MSLVTTENPASFKLCCEISGLGAKPTQLGGGEWEYQGTIDGADIRVNIDYGSRLAQLRYEINLASSDRRFPLKRAGFEAVLGVGQGDWDFIVEENVADSMALLGEFVKYVGGLSQRLSENCF